MIFDFEAPINKDVEASFLGFFIENGIDPKKAQEMASQARTFAFLVTDAEIAHRFPGYGPQVTEAPEEIQQLVSDAVAKANSLGDGKIEVGTVFKIG